MDEMDAETRDRVFAQFGTFDYDSWQANTSVRARMSEFYKGQTVTKTPWHIRDAIKYDLAMGEIGLSSDTHLYLEQTMPTVAKLKAPNPQNVLTTDDLHAWLANTFAWDGEERTYLWTIRNGQRQVAQGRIALAADLTQKARYRDHLATFRGSVGAPAPVAPVPVGAPVAAPAPAPASSPPRPVYDPLSPEAVDRMKRDAVREAVEAERARWQEELRRQQERAAWEAERRRQDEELHNLRRQLAGLAEQMERERQAGPGVDPRIEELKRQMDALQRPLAAPVPPVLSPPPGAVLGTLPPDPPAGLPPPPPGFHLAWDFGKRAFHYVPDAVAQAAPVVSAPVSPPSVSPSPPSLLSAVKQVVQQANEVKQGASLLSETLGFGNLGLDFGPPASAAAPSGALAGVEKPEEEKKPESKVFHEEGGMVFRKDKDGNVITDDVGLIDFVANGQKLGDAIEFAREFFHKGDQAKMEMEKKKLELEAERLRLEREKAEVDRQKAEASRAMAEAVLLQRKALAEAGVGSAGGGEVSSAEELPPPPESL